MYYLFSITYTIVSHEQVIIIFQSVIYWTPVCNYHIFQDHVTSMEWLINSLIVSTICDVKYESLHGIYDIKLLRNNICSVSRRDINIVNSAVALIVNNKCRGNYCTRSLSLSLSIIGSMINATTTWWGYVYTL